MSEHANFSDMMMELTKSITSEAPNDESMTETRAQAHAITLLERMSAYTQTHTFKEGDLVVWKPGLRNKTCPKYGEPVIVASVFPTPIVDTEESPSSAYYREPLTIKIGCLHEDGEMLFFHMDGNRFEPFNLGVSCND